MLAYPIVPQGIAALSSLKTISLHFPSSLDYATPLVEPVLECDVGQLSALPFLETFEFFGHFYHLQNLGHGLRVKKLPKGLEQLTNLKQLFLYEIYVENLDPLGNLTNLKTLSLEWAWSVGVSLEPLFRPLENLKILETLEIRLRSLETLKELPWLRKLDNLRKLNLMCCSLEDIENLQYQTGLEKLNLYDNPLKDLRALEHLTRLKKLKLDTKQQAAHSGAIAKLEQLNPELSMTIRWVD